METQHLGRVNRSREKSHRDMNARLNDRDMIDIHIRNNTLQNMRPMTRIDLERDEFMKSSSYDEEDAEYAEYHNNIRNSIQSRQSRQARHSRQDNLKQDNNFDKRMPLRPEFNINRPEFNNDNLFPPTMQELKNSKQINKKEFTPYEINSNFADINQDTKLTDSIQDNKICINGNTNYGLFLFDNLLETMKGPFVFSPYLIYSIFGSLFISGDGNTEVELKNYFNFPRSDVLSNGLNDIQNIMHRHQSIKQGNCLIFSSDIDYNPQFCKNINNFTKVRKINKQNIIKEADDINKIISVMTNNNDMKRSVSAELLERSSIVLLNYAYLKPIWKSYFSKTSSHEGIEFMHAYNQSFGYFDQPNLQVLELISVDDLCLGIIYGDIELNEKNIKFILSSLKLTMLQEVKIPKFRLQTKLRYTNILKETDLKTVFMDLKAPYLFNSECEISDCISNIEFNLNENSIRSDNKNNKNNANFITSKKFIVEKSFRFYLRSKFNNCILFLGTF
jgi:serine protease inhibitor